MTSLDCADDQMNVLATSERSPRALVRQRVGRERPSYHGQSVSACSPYLFPSDHNSSG
jgi:hypothetical protein